MPECKCPDCYKSSDKKFILTEATKKMLGMIPNTKKDNLPLAKSA